MLIVFLFFSPCLPVSLLGSPMPDPPPEEQSPLLLLSSDRDSVAVPMTTSPRVSPLGRPSSRELFTSSDQSGGDTLTPAEDCPEGARGPEAHNPGPRPFDMQSTAGSSIPSLNREISNGSDNQTLPPYQKPRPSNALSCSHVRDECSHSSLDPSVSTRDIWERRLLQLTSSPACGWGNPSAPQLCPPPPPICEEEEEDGMVARKLRRARKKQWSALTEADEVVEEEGGEQIDGCAGRAPKRKLSETGSPPSWLYHTQTAGHAEDHRPCEGGATGTGGGATGAEGGATGAEGGATGVEGGATGAEGGATGAVGRATGTEGGPDSTTNTRRVISVSVKCPFTPSPPNRENKRETKQL